MAACVAGGVSVWCFGFLPAPLSLCCETIGTHNVPDRERCDLGAAAAAHNAKHVAMCACVLLVKSHTC
jgi:hypothetical protein